MATITKKRIIHAVAKRLGLHHADVRNVVQTFLDVTIDCLGNHDRLEFRDFGVFEIVTRKEKIGRNPKNARVPITIPERKAGKFTAGKRMREVVENGPTGHSIEDIADDSDD
jgi:integration host factor subunit beta